MSWISLSGGFQLRRSELSLGVTLVDCHHKYVQHVSIRQTHLKMDLQLWNDSVHAYLDSKDPEESIKLIEQISNPGSRVLYNLSRCYQMLDQLPEARQVRFRKYYLIEIILCKNFWK